MKNLKQICDHLDKGDVLEMELQIKYDWGWPELEEKFALALMEQDGDFCGLRESFPVKKFINNTINEIKLIIANNK